MTAEASTPRVCVITPTFNRALMLVEAIDCVRKQTMSDYEHVIVDDGSTDGTAATLSERFGDDPRIRCIVQENKGVSAARNRGLAAARGEFVALLDSDDLWEPPYLQSQIALLDAHPEASFVVSDSRYDGAHAHDYPTAMAMPTWDKPDTVAALCLGAFAQPSSLLLRTPVAQEIGFDESLPQAEDADFLFRMADAGYRCVVNEEPYAIYRAHEGEDGQTQLTDDMIENRMIFHEICERYADQCPECRRDETQLIRRRARWLMERGRYRDARPLLWKWYKSRPDSSKALRGLIRSFFSWR